MLLYDISQTFNKSSQSPTWRVPIGSIAINPYNVPMGYCPMWGCFIGGCYSPLLSELHASLVIVQPVNYE